MAIRSASFLSRATFSRVYRLLMSAQSVISTPSHPVCSFAQVVSSSLFAWTGIPFTDAEFTMIDIAPSRMAARKGAKNFSLSSAGAI